MHVITFEYLVIDIFAGQKKKQEVICNKIFKELQFGCYIYLKYVIYCQFYFEIGHVSIFKL